MYSGSTCNFFNSFFQRLLTVTKIRASFNDIKMSQSIVQFHPCPIFGTKDVYGDLDRRAKTRTPPFLNMNVKNNDDSFCSLVRFCEDVVVLNLSADLVAYIFITFKIAT